MKPTYYNVGIESINHQSLISSIFNVTSSEINQTLPIEILSWADKEFRWSVNLLSGCLFGECRSLRHLVKKNHLIFQKSQWSGFRSKDYLRKNCRFAKFFAFLTHLFPVTKEPTDFANKKNTHTKKTIQSCTTLQRTSNLRATGYENLNARVWRLNLNVGEKCFGRYNLEDVSIFFITTRY